MSSATIHLVIPTLLVIATGLFPRKAALMWAPFTVFPDFDFIFNFFGYYVLQSEFLLHRAIFHNLFIGLPTLILAVLLWRRMLAGDPSLRAAPWGERWAAYARVRWALPAVLVTFYLESHVLLDMFQGGVTPLWPFVNTFVYPRLIIWVNTETGMPSFEGQIQSGTGAPALSPLYPWMVPEEFAILMMCAVAIAVALWVEARGAPRPWLRGD